MDIFVEQIIHRKMSPIDLLITFGITLEIGRAHV